MLELDPVGDMGPKTHIFIKIIAVKTFFTFFLFRSRFLRFVTFFLFFKRFLF